MSRPKHSKPPVEAALRYGESLGWTYVRAGSGHTWGIFSCESGPPRGNCRVSVWSTPKNPDTFAKQLRRTFNNCPHTTTTEGLE